MNPYRVLIADDHSLARLAVRSLLEDEPGFTIVGEAADGCEAVALCEYYEPDVVLLDIRMPDMSGLEATKQIKSRLPGTKVVILSVSDSVQDLFTAVQYGAQGYLLKSMDPADWLTYLVALLEDSPHASGQLADKLFLRFRSNLLPAPPENSGTGAGCPVLTPREREIAVCVAKGVKNKEIAEELTISEYTVKNHVKNILDKLDLDNRVQLTTYVMKMGWINQEDLN